MNEWWAVVMLFTGGLFAGGVISIAWERGPAWRKADLPDFRAGFAHTLRRVDRVQPVLLSLFLLSTIAFAVGEGGVARTMAVLAAAAGLLVLLGSLVFLVPLQRKLVAAGSGQPSLRVDEMRARWLRGHLIRAAGTLFLFMLAIVAASV